MGNGHKVKDITNAKFWYPTMHFFHPIGRVYFTDAEKMRSYCEHASKRAGEYFYVIKGMTVHA